MGTARIIIEISGGNVQSITTNGEKLEVYIHDWDNAKAWEPGFELGFEYPREPHEVFTERQFERRINRNILEAEKIAKKTVKPIK